MQSAHAHHYRAGQRAAGQSRDRCGRDPGTSALLRQTAFDQSNHLLLLVPSSGARFLRSAPVQHRFQGWRDGAQFDGLEQRPLLSAATLLLGRARGHARGSGASADSECGRDGHDAPGFGEPTVGGTLLHELVRPGVWQLYSEIGRAHV